MVSLLCCRVAAALPLHREGGETVKKQVNPAAMAGIIIGAVALLGFLIWRTMGAKPAYPGANAGQPTKRLIEAPTGNVTPQQAFQKGIPGANPGAAAPR
jgi:hypothetical protein